MCSPTSPTATTIIVHHEKKTTEDFLIHEKKIQSREQPIMKLKTKVFEVKKFKFSNGENRIQGNTLKNSLRSILLHLIFIEDL